MALIKYEPFAATRNFQDQINQLLGRGWGSMLNPMLMDETTEVATADWVPSVDVKEEKDHYLVRADLPGVDPKDIDISFENGMLTLSGERKWEEKEDRKGYYRAERFHGQFYRRFSLPTTADVDKTSARSDKGVLEIKIPKSAKSLSHKIKITS